jgi:hypothetical protein
MPQQNADGTGHTTLQSFIWDGHSPAIEIAYGGYGEPVRTTIPTPQWGAGRTDEDGLAAQVMADFVTTCLAYLLEPTS